LTDETFMESTKENFGAFFVTKIERREYMKTIAVFFGGNSNEREISVITGMMVTNLLRTTEHRILPVYLTQEGMLFAERASGVEDVIAPKKPFPPVVLIGRKLVLKDRPKRVLAELDCALNCCHGGTGEDGTLSALLAWHGVPSASPDMQLSSAFMDKSIAKIVVRGLGIPVLPSETVWEEEWKNDAPKIKERVKAFGYPVVIKPCRLGSSIGISVAHTEEELSAALQLAFKLDDSALIEQYLPDRRDLNCAAYRKNGELVLSPVEEVFSASDILTFREKYESETACRSELPARIPQEITETVQRALTEIYTAFHAVGVVRADFLLSGQNVYFNELNTVPGSLAYYLFSESLTNARTFLLDLIDGACLPSQKPPIVTGILSRTQFGGAKGGKRLVRPR